MDGFILLYLIQGAVLGLILAVCLCILLRMFKIKFNKTRFVLILFPINGFMVSFYLLHEHTERNKRVIEVSFGNYDNHRGGLGVISIPDDFNNDDMKMFYDAINDSHNKILSPYTFSAALVSLPNGNRHISLNVRPSLDTKDYDNYSKINNELKRQKDLIVAQDPSSEAEQDTQDLGQFTKLHGKVSFTLEDGEALSQKNSDTFWIPNAERRENLVKDDLVKLIFNLTDGTHTQGERMWVIVKGGDKSGYIGVLDNDPYCTDQIKTGMEVTFNPRHVIDIFADENPQLKEGTENNSIEAEQ